MIRGIRTAVILSSEWPGLGSVYRGLYTASIARAAWALRGGDDLQVWLRGSAASRVRPGLSDIDLVLLPGACANVDGEARVCRELAARIGLLNRPLPLFRDVHVLFPDELAALCTVGAAIAHALAKDGRCIAGLPSLPPLPGDPNADRELLVREALYWAHRAGEHLASSDDVLGRRLAGRALDKGQDATEKLLSDHAEARGAPPASTDLDAMLLPSWERFTELLRDLDRALRSLPDTGEADAHSSPAPAPDNMSGADAADGFVEAALRLSSVDTVLRTRDGSSHVDRRTYVVVDPAHRELPADLRQLSRMRMQVSPSHWSGRTYGAPWITTAAQLQRSVCMPMSVFEPLDRANAATLHGAPLGDTHATDAQVARSAVEKLVKLASRARESRPGGPDVRDRAMLDDGIETFAADVTRLLGLPVEGLEVARHRQRPSADWEASILALRELERKLLPVLVRMAIPVIDPGGRS